MEDCSTDEFHIFSHFRFKVGTCISNLLSRCCVVLLPWQREDGVATAADELLLYLAAISVLMMMSVTQTVMNIPATSFTTTSNRTNND